MLIYLDGEIWHQQGGKTKPFGAIAKFSIAARPLGQTWKWNGSLAEFRIWSKVRSQTEIKENQYKSLQGDESGLLGYWPLRDGSVLDYSQHQRHGILAGAAQQVDFEKIPLSSATQTAPTSQNTALKFNGTNDYIEVPYTAALNPSEFTVSLWVRVTGGQSSYRSPLTSRDDSPTRGYIFYASPSNVWEIWTGANDTWYSVTGPAIALNTWTHIAATFKNGILTLYTDGQLQEQKNASYEPNTAHPLRIGAGVTENVTPNYLFPGEIAEVQIWNKALTEAEIQAKMNRTRTGTEVNLVGYWPLRDISAKDYSPHSSDGTLHGSPQKVKLAHIPSPATNTGKTTTITNAKNTALELDGTTHYIEFSKGLPSIDKAITIEFWSKGSSQLSKYTSIFEAYNAQDTRVLNIHLPHNQIIYWDAGNDNGYDRIYKTATSAEYQGSWVHWAFVKDSVAGKMLIYRNGEIWHEESGKNKALPNVAKFVIGAYVNTNHKWSGALGEFRIWNIARSQTEIKAKMNVALTGSESNLVGYWPLRDGTAKDYSSHKNDGTIQGSVQTVSFDKVKAETLKASPYPFGKLAEVRIWGTALSDEEIEVNSKTLLTGNEPGLLAYYPLNDNNDSEAEDQSKNNEPAKLFGTSSWGCAAPIGHLGNAVMAFDGKESYISADAGLLNDLKAFTLEGWIKIDQFESNQTYISLFGADEAIEFGINNQKLDIWTRMGGAITANQNDLTMQKWHHVAVVGNGQQLSLYLDGVNIANGGNSTTSYGESKKVFQIGAGLAANRRQDKRTENPFIGLMAEIRVWQVARSTEQIQTTMHRYLTGTEEDLVAYWPLNTVTENNTTPDVLDQYPGTVHGDTTQTTQEYSLPIVGDALITAEYDTITLDPVTQKKSAMMRRAFVSPGLNGARLLAEKRIETLMLQWVGNTQFAPTLLGYIEGAPPIPSENLTVQPDYNGATAVELSVSEDVEFRWNRSEEEGLGASFDLFAGAEDEVNVMVGPPGAQVEKKLFDFRAGFKGNVDFSEQSTNESNVTASASNNMSDRLELRGSLEQTAKFPHLGKRFVPKNVGYALVISSLADVFVTKLKRSGRMVSYETRPVEGIPPDVNTITFLINPAYTMNGSLDGMTGSSATSQRFFRHVPEMRAQYGSLYPASYFRLKEAYALKQAIEREDKMREAYFMQFDSRALNDTEFNSNVGGEAEFDTSNVEGQKKELQEQQSDAAKEKKAEIDARITDQEKRVRASSSFAAWQRRMESILIKAGKRNIVNTYVWDGDGGVRTEAQSFANTVEHSIGGSFTLDAGLGFEGSINAGGFTGELTALATINLTQTLNKTDSRSQGIQLNIDLSGVEHIGITDYKDYPIQPGEKVDRYRFMSFYLEGKTDHFYDFFDYVVDPEWLRSNDEEARALRQTMAGKANKTWRVLHRVTYVERPVLMGFGRDLRKTAEEEDRATQEILDYFTQLETRHKELKDMLTEILRNQRNANP
ncbi:MAG: LamG domain-containing protein [Spirulina sp. SIO3F2]|nr:LamG domain-containing protein [Spirulina sp. SIO3F2]